MSGKIIEELDAANASKARNIWGNELVLRKDMSTGKSGYYHYNSHGDVVAISDGNGQELNSYAYDTWGNVISKTEGMPNPYQYSGEPYNEKTGLYYLRARYYDPKVGRFISEDTYKGAVDNPLTLNRYTYVHNNPIRYFDPTGNQAVEYASVGGGGSGVVLPVSPKEAFNIITFGTLMWAAAPKEAPQVTQSRPNLTVIQGGKSKSNNKNPRTLADILPKISVDEDKSKKNIDYRALNHQDLKTILGGQGIVAKKINGPWSVQDHVCMEALIKLGVKILGSVQLLTFLLHNTLMKKGTVITEL